MRDRPTPAQAQNRRFTGRVASFDPDAAGQRGAKSCEMLVSEGFDANAADPVAGEAVPYVRKHGHVGDRERLKTSTPYLEFLLDRRRVDITSIRTRAGSSS